VKKEYILQLNGKHFTLGQQTCIMGVINVTPDSFSDGGIYFNKDQAIQRGLELISEGSDIIDIGGESSRPGSYPVSSKEELKRVIPVISALREKTDAPISIDTTKSEVAKAALEEGADIINDISSFRFDPEMLPLAAQTDATVILMHMKGTPKTMQDNPYYDDVLNEVKSFFEERIETAQASGVKTEKIIIDPGIGFGKRLIDNLTLINKLAFFNELNHPILIGVSRKSFIGNILDLPPHERMEGTIASSVLSIIKGAHILRVHDVAPIRRAIAVTEAIINENSTHEVSKPYRR
jgi:dihydropteroate synthase